MSRTAQLAEDRRRIQDEADPIGLLTEIAKGKPISILDWEGEIVGVDRPTIDHRVTAARELLRKIVPDLRSVDVTANEGAGITFVFDTAGVPLPGSQRAPIDADQVLDQVSGHLMKSIEDAVIEDDDDAD